jgi:RNA polymerase sigma-70 factor (ECF subfamily)
VNELADNLVMLKVRDGEVGKPGILFERHHIALYNYFLRQTGRRDASEDFEENQKLAQLRAALAKLAPEKREVLVLSRYQNMKYEEIAEWLGCAVGTVKARVDRAIKDLKDIYFELSHEKTL